MARWGQVQAMSNDSDENGEDGESFLEKTVLWAILAILATGIVVVFLTNV